MEASPPADYVPGEVLVTFKPMAGVAEAQRVLRGRGLGLTRHFDWLSKHHGRQMGLVRARNRTTAELIADLEKDPSVERVEPNYIRRVFGTQPPNDLLFGQLWGLRNTGQTVRGARGTAGADIRFLEAWSLARPSTSEIVVAVIDTGVDYTHPDLAANMWHNPGEVDLNGIDDDGNGYVDDYYGYNFADGDKDPMDASEHGTHVAGTIAGVGNNGIGVAGVDYKARIMALRTALTGDSSGDLSSAAIIEAVQYATQMKNQGVNVVAINASYGGASYSSMESAAILAANAAGIVFCAAAGNEAANNDSVPVYPANYRLPNMIVVAASDSTDGLGSFSNYGSDSVDLAAPGVNVLSSTPPGITSYVHTASATYVGEALEYSGLTAGLAGTLHDCGLGYSTNFPASVRGNLALISRGTLFFSEKVRNAIAAGAKGVVLYNNSTVPVLGSLQSPSNWIPAIMLSQADGLALKAALPQEGTLVSIRDTNVLYQFLNGTSMATPHVAGAVAFAARNFPEESVAQRIQRLLTHVDSVSGLAGRVKTGGRLNLLRIVDADGNGLPDWWEQQFFGIAGAVDPSADSDRDGLPNLQEFLADTSPADRESLVRFTAVAGESAGTRLSWRGGVESRQLLQRTATPNLAQSWVDVWTNQPPTALEASFVDESGTNQAAFYRLRVERP
jgi:subtilisin family serine protease